MGLFPLGCTHASSSNIKFVNVDNDFLKSVKKDKAELQKFFDCAIKDENCWNSLSSEVKHRIIKVIETSEDPYLHDACIKSISELSPKIFNKFFDDVENPRLIDFLNCKIKLSELSSKDLNDILSFCNFIKYPNSNNTNSHLILNYMLLKKNYGLNIADALDNVEENFLDNFNEDNLPQYLEIAQLVNAENLFKTCFTYLKEKIGVPKWKIDAKEFLVTIEDSDKVDLNQLEKYVKLFEKTNRKIKIELYTIQNKEIEIFVDRFKNDISQLDFSKNKELKELPDWVRNLINLESLRISWTSITTLPEFIGDLKNLQVLDLSRCHLETLPESIGKLTNLQALKLLGYSKKTLPDWLENLTNLQVLDLTYIKIKTLPNWIGSLTNLHTLILSQTKIDALPESIRNLKNLHTLCLGGTKIRTLPDTIENLMNLQTLNLTLCCLTTLPDWIENLGNLQNLDLSCSWIEALPDSFGNLKNLQTLDLSDSNITKLPESIKNLKNLQTLDLSDCRKLNKLCSFEGMINLKSISLSWILSHDFNLLKIFLELDKTPEEIEKILSITISNEIISSLKSIKKNLNSFGVKSLNDISHLELKKSKLNVLDTFLSYARILPDVKNKIFSFLFEPSPDGEKKIIDESLLDNFKIKNKEYIQQNAQIDNLDEFLLALKLGIKVSNPNIIKQALLDYFESEDLEIRKTVILNDEVKEFLKTEEGKEILINFRNETFYKINVFFLEFLRKEFPFSEDKNCNFYPIRISENLDILSIVCLQNQVRDPKNLQEILTKLVKINNSKEVKVLYWDQVGIDEGALTKNFILNLFYAAMSHWNLNKEIPKVESKNLVLLGPLLKYVLDSDGARKLFTGEVFHDSFFRGMLEFDFNQITSDYSLSNAEISKILNSGFSEEIIEVINFLGWNDFSDSKKNRVCIETLLKFYINEGVDLDPKLMDLIGDEVFESSILILIKLTLLNKLPLDDSLINLIGKHRYEAIEKGSDESKLQFIKDHKIQLESWVKEDLEIRTMILKMNLRKAHLNRSNLNDELLDNAMNIDDSTDVDELTDLQDWKGFGKLTGLEESMDLINDPDFEIKYIKDEKKLNAIENWIKEDPVRLEKLKETFREDVFGGFIDQIKNLHAILKSMNFNEEQWLAIKAEGVQAFKLKIQGEFSKEQLLQKVFFRDRVDFKAIEGLQEGTSEYAKALENATIKFDPVTKASLIKWFVDADENQLKKFSEYVTGFPTTPVRNINIFELPEFYEEIDANGVINRKRFLFQVHACFNQLDVPLGLTEKQIFFYMDSIIADKKGTFDFR